MAVMLQMNVKTSWFLQLSKKSTILYTESLVSSPTMADAKQGKAPTEDFCNGSSQSRVVLAKPRLGGFGSSLASSSSKTSNPFGSVLRPPQLKPSINPFVKVTTTEHDKEDKGNEESGEDRLKEVKEEPEIPKFVPLASTNATPRSTNTVPAVSQVTTSTTNASGFVFGQNLSERVMMQENANNGEASSGHSSSNGTTELLFTSAATAVASVKDNNQDEASTSEARPAGGSSLAAAAAEYERIHARPPPPTANFSHTGEEDEINVLQTTCRLFAWESGSWRERGRGVLRLNDAAAGGGAARLVVRVSGSLRVALNTKLWPDMVLERAGTKSLRISAADANNQIKLFLIMGAPLDITQLHRALQTRVAASRRATAATNASQRAAERLEASYSAEIPGDSAEALADSDHDRLDPIKQKTEEYESNVDGMVEPESKPLKRKEPVDDETSPKRPCPDVTE